ncbi:MAG: DUF2911 domain-containing protein [Myxococcales bacterium]|nr:DUF2911 domain-containing protein [Myxococcales bacterium]
MKLRSLGVLLIALSGCIKSAAESNHSVTNEPHSPSSGSSSAPNVTGHSAPLAPPARGSDTDRKSKNGTLSATVGDVPLLLQYGRPHVSERKIFGELVPYGEVWRTGADEATTLTIQTPAVINGQPVQAGNYALFTIPGPETWTLILNSQAKQWGAYKHDPALDVLKVKVPATKTQTPTEILTFAATASAVTFSWENTKVTIPVSAK